jgi:hypothetical protein
LAKELQMKLGFGTLVFSSLRLNMNDKRSTNPQATSRGHRAILGIRRKYSALDDPDTGLRASIESVTLIQEGFVLWLSRIQDADFRRASLTRRKWSNT